LAVVLIGLWGYRTEQNPQPSYSPHAAQGETAEQGDSKPHVVGAVSPTGAPHNEHDSQTASDGGEQPKDGLLWGDGLAQWAMAAAAVLSLLISGWAVWLVKRTFDKTAEAVATAREANATARELGEAQVRAYVTCTECEVSKIGVGLKPRANLKFKNSGQSPAANVRIKVAVRTDRFPQSEHVVVLAWSTEDTRGMAAGGEVPVEQSAKVPMTEETFAQFQGDGLAIYVFVELSYIDVFGMQNDVEQRFVYRKHLMPKSRSAEIAAYGNRFRWGHKKAD
jgi:hypothetical protein